MQILEQIIPNFLENEAAAFDDLIELLFNVIIY
jgi:hypothetical protein